MKQWQKNQQARYLPFLAGQYSTAPGLHRLETDWGNGPADQRIFQFDARLADYLCNKADCRTENLDKYFTWYLPSASALHEACRLIMQRLAKEYPQHFSLDQHVGELMLHSQSPPIVLQQTRDESRLLQVFNHLAFCLQEDLAIWQQTERGDYMSCIHLCAPNHWAPADKIGRPFSEVHAPVAGMEQMRQRYRPMLRSLAGGGTMVRFAWGMSTDTRLNHHPEAPPGISPEIWQGRRFNPREPELYVRVERQTLSGLRESKAVLFTIKTYFEDVRAMNPLERQALSKALGSMSAASLSYKGLSDSLYEIRQFLSE
jgi:hypothetical protein